MTDAVPSLSPAPQEVASLRLHVTDWDECDAWQQSVCVAILRGDRTIDTIMAHLGATREQVWAAARPLLGNGLLYDGSQDLLLLK